MKRNKEQITTARLINILKDVRTDGNIQGYMGRYGDTFYESFAEYINDYIAENKLTIPDLVQKSNISTNYVYNILNGDRKPGRDKVIALCVGAGMNYTEINRALNIAKLGILYPKDERDARIIIAVNKGVRNITELNMILEEANLAILE